MKRSCWFFDKFSGHYIVTLECVQNNLEVPEEVASFVLPIGATINKGFARVFTRPWQLFIAQAFGMD
jgi:Na+/H+-dicarboxylate symporter